MIASHLLAGFSRRPWRAVVAAAAVIAVSLYGVAKAGAESADSDQPTLGLKLLSDTAAHDEFYRVVTVLPDSQLRKLRGGFTFGALQFDFAADVRVFANGVLVASTSIILNDDGTLTETPTIHDPAVASLFMRDGPVGLHGLANMKGFTIKKDGVPIAVATHSIGLDHTTSAVINTAPRQSIQQFITTNLTINNFDEVQTRLLNQAAVQRLAGAAASDPLLQK